MNGGEATLKAYRSHDNDNIVDVVRSNFIHSTTRIHTL